MIYLTKGQTLFDNPGMVVYDPTGYYDDGSSVVCAAAFAPEEPVCRYEAKFIAYGDLVYNITDPEKLMEEVIKIDPKSLFSKSNKDVALDTVVENIQTVESQQGEVPQNPVVQQDQTPITSPDQVESSLASSTPLTPIDPYISTTTPVTTETVIPIAPDVPAESTLEEIIPIVENVIEDATRVKEITESMSTTSPLTEITF